MKNSLVASLIHVSVRLLTLKISQWACENFCSVSNFVPLAKRDSKWKGRQRESLGTSFERQAAQHPAQPQRAPC